MAELIRCDACGTETRACRVTGWLRVEEQGEPFALLGDPTPPLPWHFCSLPCLAVFGKRQQARETRWKPPSTTATNAR